MLSTNTLKYLHWFFSLVALIAGLINALSNLFYPCALTLIPASMLYFMATIQEKELWMRGNGQILLITIGLGILYAGIWELFILTSWNDLLHIFMALTGVYFLMNVKIIKKSLLIGNIGGIGFIILLRVAYVIGLFSLNLNLKIPVLQEYGSWIFSIIVTASIWIAILVRSNVKA